MKHKRNWIIGIALSATAAFVALQTVNAPAQDEAIPNSETPFTETASTLRGNCYFTWAYQDAPELTNKLDTSVKELNQSASATATLFGEDCTYEDGASTFGAMETDFTIRLPVEDLSSHEEFGNWIKQVMQIVTQFPREELPGPNYGFVEFRFEKNETENIIVRVPIKKYIDEAKEKNGLELFNYFYQP